MILAPRITRAKTLAIVSDSFFFALFLFTSYRVSSSQFITPGPVTRHARETIWSAAGFLPIRIRSLQKVLEAIARHFNKLDREIMFLGHILEFITSYSGPKLIMSSPGIDCPYLGISTNFLSRQPRFCLARGMSHSISNHCRINICFIVPTPNSIYY